MSARVKICGINTADAMAAALEARADLVGLVFFPPSPRAVTLEVAQPLADYARGYAGIVALVVDASDDDIEGIVATIDPDMLQLHGNESPQRVAAIRERFGKAVMKAIKIATADDARAALHYRGVADLILFDAKPPAGADRPGGHGVAFDWQVLADVRHEIAFMLSGGLHPGNVAESIRATGATVVDVSSGVESAPGIKDPHLIAAFIRAAKGTPT